LVVKEMRIPKKYPSSLFIPNFVSEHNTFFIAQNFQYAQPYCFNLIYCIRPEYKKQTFFLSLLFIYFWLFRFILREFYTQLNSSMNSSEYMLS
jgi:hypothetical protein